MAKLVSGIALLLVLAAVLAVDIMSNTAFGDDCDRELEICELLEEKHAGRGKGPMVDEPSEKPEYISYACNAGVTGVGACETDKECPDGTKPYSVLPRSFVESTGSGLRGGLSQDIQCLPGDVQSTAEVVAAEFAKTRPEVPFPTIQDGGIMLVNWPIVFSSTVTQYDAQTSALGRAVTLRVIPMEYVWNFGDGNKETTKTPGKPIDVSDATDYDQGYRAYVDKYASIYHLYEKCGFINPSLSVTFRGQYSLDGVTFHNIPGTVTTDSPVQQLRLYEARAELVDPNRPMPSPKSTSCVAEDKD